MEPKLFAHVRQCTTVDQVRRKAESEGAPYVVIQACRPFVLRADAPCALTGTGFGI